MGQRFWSAAALAAATALSAASPAPAPAASPSDPPEAPEPLSLAGEWRFTMSGPEPREQQGELPAVTFDDTIALPATTETARKGAVQGPGWSGQLTRVYKFSGPAWYQRDVTIPEAWAGKRLTLFLERTKYAQAWLDDRPIGASPILCTPHGYELGTVEPGPHRLTVVVDNTRLPVPGDNHQTSDNTQGNWNGILGRMELRATDDAWIEDVQVYPDAAARSIAARVWLGGRAGPTRLGVRVAGEGYDLPLQWSDAVPTGEGYVEARLALGEEARLWDEFQPNLYELTVEMEAGGARDARKVSFGLRDFATRGTQFTVNGRPTFLRGRHDACVFPLTGHPPMDVDGWIAYFQRCQEWGINHVRFHSWCPPEAAFTAADRLGVYLQPELPFWGEFNDEVKAKLGPEAERIVRAYGNHPSFVMFALGNENRGSRDVMASLIAELRAQDPRRLYAQGSNAFMWDPVLPAGDDFLVSARAKRGPGSPSRNIRGSHATVDHSDGHVQFGPPNTRADYAAAIEGMTGPAIGHEVGQYSVYPNFDEIAKYTGVRRADNLAHFRGRLERAGMLDQAEDFFRASGKLSALCYREEIETALRTPGFGGFQLLDLQDFPGQGTALVGMLDAFMEPKGAIEPERWREFCGPVTLLARFDKYTWTPDETFTAAVQAAHYGEADLDRAAVTWELRGDDGVVAAGRFLPGTLEPGDVRPVGSITTPLSGLAAPAVLSLELAVEGTPVRTSYPLWVYPPTATTEPPAGVTTVRGFDAAARQALASGGRVLLIPDGSKPFARTVGGGFATDFWCWPMFHNKPGTMGLLCDPEHPALAAFPTESHSNWQWFHLAANAQPLVLDDLPAGYKPLVQVIDNMERVHKLGLVFELKVGSGRLLVCATDLSAMRDRPEARQLLASLAAYAASDGFDPQTEASVEQLEALFRTTIPIRGKATASTYERSWQNFQADRAIDGNDYTGWRAAEPERRNRGDGANFGAQAAAPDASQATAADAPAEVRWRLDFDEPQTLQGAEILWGDDEPGFGYVVESSRDGQTWQPLGDRRENASTGGRHGLEFPAVTGVRAVRIRITDAPERARVGIREIRFFSPT